MSEVPQSQLPIVQRVALALGSDAVEKEFRELAAESASITAITNPASYEECHAARMRLVKARTSTTKRGKEVREDAQAFAKGVIAEENRLIGIIKPEEDRLQALQAAEDAKREAKIAAERKRVEEIEQRIAAIESSPLQLAGRPAVEIAAAQVELSGLDLSGWAMEFIDKAQAVKEKTLLAIGQLHAGALATEKAAAEAAAKLKAEQEELARLRAEAKERADNEAKLQAEARAKLEAEERAAREAREAADRAAQEARDRADAEAKAKRDAEEARLKAQREEIEAKQRAADEAARKVREELEAKAAAERKAKEEAEREARRLETELMDGATLLTAFKDRFGKRREFAQVVKAIDTYFATRKVAA